LREFAALAGPASDGSDGRWLAWRVLHGWTFRLYNLENYVSI
jgi:hypothetical protein